MITLHLHACTIGDGVPLTLCWENFSFNAILPGEVDLTALNGIVATLDKQFKTHPVSSYDEGYFWLNRAIAEHTSYSTVSYQPFQSVSS